MDVFWYSQAEVDQIISKNGSKVPYFGLKSTKIRPKITNLMQVMHYRKAGVCQKFEKFYFFKEIYVNSEKMNFQSIMAPEDQCTPHHLKKVLKNGWFWLNSTISYEGTVQRCCTIGQTKNFKILQFFLFF